MEWAEVLVVLGSAWADMERAVKGLSAPLTPTVPYPRGRSFMLLDGLRWRFLVESYGKATYVIEREGEKSWTVVHGRVDSATGKLDNAVAYEVHERTKGQPRVVAKLLVRLRAVTEWCCRRRDGMERHAAEVVRQQQAYEDQLQSELALVKIAKTGR